ncbi:phage major tail protein, TP901-1 family [Staphylococcus sp. IVB6238]|uniref:phage major tail protein, TP901-1 family n=1 Tax=Staphylococcus sp. IVB6238 TaxID=2989770 RepID=UPI0021D096F3|nr:phage major tail protein, TP901-1 family [Staphylococcus sp. IVB6238]UXR73298.1 phage major tail protein, TP901-1 family [Staphylococcus sp. IVB6238]
MAEMIKGQNTLVLIRKCYEAVDADKVLHMMEWELEVERDSDSESTFEGSYNKGGSLQTTMAGTAKLAKGDPTSRTVLNAILNDERYEKWIFDGAKVNPDNPKEFEAIYAQGYFTKFSEKGEVDEVVEYEEEFAVEEKIKFGFSELPQAVQDIASAYGFHKPVAADPAKVDEIPSAVEPTV